MKEQLSLQGPANAASLEQLLAQVEAFGLRQSWSTTEALQVRLILEELLVNVMNYGSRASQTPNVALTLTQNKSELEILLCDDGIAFDPLQLPTPELLGDVTQRSVGGLGVFLVRSLADKVRYQRQNQRNCLWVNKVLT